MVLLTVVMLGAAGCGSSSAPPKAAPVAPPAERSVAQTASALLAPLHLQVQRSSVGQKPPPQGGSELSLYAQPARTESVDVYAQRFMPLAAKVVPALFAKYPGIQWIDLCQEPARSSGTWETVPVTRLEISRVGSGRVDWARGDLATVLALNRTRPLELAIEWHNGIGATSVWAAATARSIKLGG
jgi:hypothetical protein